MLVVQYSIIFMGTEKKSNAMSETPARVADRGAKVPILRSRKPSVFLTETQSSFASVVLEFVQEFLLPRILLDSQLRPKCEFTGAVILDCVLNYNNTQNSQDIEEDWATLVPTAATNIVRNQSKNVSDLYGFILT